MHYNGANSYLLVNGVKIFNCEAKDLETEATPLCLEANSKEFSVDDMGKTKLNGHIYDFSR